MNPDRNARTSSKQKTRKTRPRSFHSVSLDAWDTALRRHVARGRGGNYSKPLASFDWAKVAETAFRVSNTTAPFDPPKTWAAWAKDILPAGLLDAAKFATLGLSFPVSGDVVPVDVSAFPGGLVLGTWQNASFARADLLFHLHMPSVEKLELVAGRAIVDALIADDAAEFGVDHEIPVDDEGVNPGEFFGGRELRTAWARRLRSLQRRAAARKTATPVRRHRAATQTSEAKRTRTKANRDTGHATGRRKAVDWRKRLWDKKKWEILAWDWKENPRPYIRALCKSFDVRPALKELDPSRPEILLGAIAKREGLRLYEVPSLEGSDVYGFILSRDTLTKREMQQIEAWYWGEEFDEVYN